MEIISFGLVSSVAVAIILVVILAKAVKFVPQNRAFVVERFGKYTRTLEAGLNFLNPFFDRVAYNRTLKEQAVDVPSQGAITRDNISLIVDGVLYLKVLDPYKASYGVDDYVYAVTQLAQTTMRSEIGKIELDKTFEEREALNNNIVSQINEAAGPWGVMVLRYEIKDIEPPRTVLDAMVMEGANRVPTCGPVCGQSTRLGTRMHDASLVVQHTHNRAYRQSWHGQNRSLRNGVGHHLPGGLVDVLEA